MWIKIQGCTHRYSKLLLIGFQGWCSSKFNLGYHKSKCKVVTHQDPKLLLLEIEGFMGVDHLVRSS